jgi:hypothetical protein
MIRVDKVQKWTKRTSFSIIHLFLISSYLNWGKKPTRVNLFQSPSLFLRVVFIQQRGEMPSSLAANVLKSMSAIIT